jgi:hypothetical protein
MARFGIDQSCVMMVNKYDELQSHAKTVCRAGDRGETGAAEEGTAGGMETQSTGPGQDATEGGPEGSRSLTVAVGYRIDWTRWPEHACRGQRSCERLIMRVKIA